MKFEFSDPPRNRNLRNCIPEGNETELVLPEGVTYIHDAAFRRCDGITRLTLPSTVRQLDGSLFSTMTSLERIEICDHPDLVSKDGVLYRHDTPTTLRIVRYPAGRAGDTFVVPEDVHIIGRYAFSNAVHLEKIAIPQDVWDVQRGAFSMCPRLRLVRIDSSHLLYLREDSLRFCKCLESVEFRGELEHIEDRVFHGCVSLKRILLPDQLTSLGKEVFACCAALEEVTLPPSVSSIGMDVFYDCGDALKIRCQEAVADLIPEHHDRIDLLPSF